MIVLDTHTLVFWIQAEDYLSSTAVNAIETASTIGVSSVSFWEVSLLVRKGRLSLADNVTVRSWAQRVLQIPRVEDIPINAAIAVIADSLDMHSDPADRFIAASALSVHAPLVTQDRLLGGYDWLDTIWQQGSVSPDEFPVVVGISICYWEPRLTSHNLLTESITVALPQLSGTQSPDARTVAPWLGQADPEVTRIVGFGSTFETWRTYREDSDIDLGVQGGDVTALSRSMPEGEFEVSLVELDLQNAEFKEHVPTHGEVLYEKQ